MRFSEIEKRRLGLEVPVEIAALINDRSFRESKSYSEVATELFCTALHRDPKKFGLEPARATA